MEWYSGIITVSAFAAAGLILMLVGSVVMWGVVLLKDWLWP